MKDARPCKYCGHTYVKPCDGKDTKCGNYAHATTVRAAKKGKDE